MIGWVMVVVSAACALSFVLVNACVGSLDRWRAVGRDW